MATPATVMQEAAGVFLNDTPRTLFTDAILLPFLTRAWNDLQLEMDKKQIQTTKEVAAPATVAALAVVMTLPTDFITPIKMEERTVSSSDLYMPMEEKEWEKNILQTERLRYWVYREGEIKFPGATTAREVLLYYRKGISLPASGTDLPILRVENYLSAQTAGYAAKFIMQSDTRAETIFGFAKKALDDFFTIQVRQQQFQENRPHRYLSRFRRRSHR